MKRICRQDLLRLSSVAAFFLFFICSSFAQSTIPIADGGVMYYEETGSGEPVLLLHGHTLDRRMWDGQVEYLKESFRLIVPDMRGYGKTTDPREGYQFTHMDDILTLMDSLHIEKAHVVGLSMGAYVAGDMQSLPSTPIHDFFLQFRTYLFPVAHIASTQQAVYTSAFITLNIFFHTCYVPAPFRHLL